MEDAFWLVGSRRTDPFWGLPWLEADFKMLPVRLWSRISSSGSNVLNHWIKKKDKRKAYSVRVQVLVSSIIPGENDHLSVRLPGFSFGILFTLWALPNVSLENRRKRCLIAEEENRKKKKSKLSMRKKKGKKIVIHTSWTLPSCWCSDRRRRG